MGIEEKIWKEGRQEGIAEATLKLVRSFLLQGVSVDVIVEASELPREKVLELKSELQIA